MRRRDFIAGPIADCAWPTRYELGAGDSDLDGHGRDLPA
jgi:hypothetical protein